MSERDRIFAQALEFIGDVELQAQHRHALGVGALPELGHTSGAQVRRSANPDRREKRLGHNPMVQGHGNNDMALPRRLRVAESRGSLVSGPWGEVFASRGRVDFHELSGLEPTSDGHDAGKVIK